MLKPHNKLDFTQYEAEDKKLILTNIYDLVPSELKNNLFAHIYGWLFD